MKQHHRLGILVLIISPLLGLLAGVGSSRLMAVDKIIVISTRASLAREVARQLEVPIGASMLFYPLSRITEQAQHCYRVKDVSVNRVSPHEIAVTVTAQEPYAAVLVDGEYTVISRQGLCLYREPSAPPKLPVLIGMAAGRPALGTTFPADRMQWVHDVLAGATKVALREGLEVDLTKLHRITVRAQGLQGTLGNVNSLTRKMTVLGRLMEQLREQGVRTAAIDVSIPEKPRWSVS